LSIVRFFFIFLLIMLAASAIASAPGPGDVFREYGWKGSWVNAGNWQRVTDPHARHSGAKEFLPNPVNTVAIDDLEGAVRAEVYLEQWGGHAGTSNKRLRLNGRDWIAVPEPEGIPAAAGLRSLSPECFQYFAYPSVPVPLEQLREGENTFEFSCDGQVCFDFGWGQWGVYGVTFRIFYASSKPHAAGRIVSPAPGASFGDSLRIVLESPAAAVAQVDFIGLYEDFDYEGNGLFRQWHFNYRYGEIQRHLGTATEAPYAMTWRTDWVPDQEEPVQLMARLRDTDGVYSMTEIVGDLSLVRSGRSVKLYKPYDVPPHWQTRTGNRQSCKVFVPHDLRRAGAAQMILTTWSGGHADAIGVNDSTIVRRVGKAHDYSYDEIEVPLELLRGGINTFFTYSRTEHHGIEVLWPGIVLKVQYEGAAGSTAVLRESPASVPRAVRLLPNFPNPFNDGTTIRFFLPERRAIDLGIYNLVGQRLVTLEKGVGNAGAHARRWDGRDASGRELASGVYLYRLRAGTQVETRRMLLLR